jgi:hypothetical protein
VSAAALARFQEAVLADTELQRRLLVATDRTVFVALVVQLAHERGCDVEPDDVEDGLRDGRRTWLERWI